MTPKTIKDPRQRILDAAISLFAKKGYAGAGVREIAKKANVNIAMISYYFEGKVGILKTIINEFHNQYNQVIKDAIDESLSPEECVRSIVLNIVNFVKTNPEITEVVFNAFPLDIPEVAKIKAERVSELVEGISGLMTRFDLDPKDGTLMSIIGPGVLSIVLAHFRFKTIQKNVLKIELNNAFYERYTETLTTLLLHGITGIAAQTQKTKGNNNEKNS